MSDKPKIDYEIPLTPEQAEFAEQNHNFIYDYLHRYNLPIDDYYGLAAIGLVRAVQAWYQSEYVRGFQFSTIAFWNMKALVYNSRRQDSKHAVTGCSLDISVEGIKESLEAVMPDPKASVSVERILDSMVLEDIFSQLTTEERILLVASADELTQSQIAEIIGTTQVTISRRIRKIKALIKSRYQRVA